MFNEVFKELLINQANYYYFATIATTYITSVMPLDSSLVIASFEDFFGKERSKFVTTMESLRLD
jgi:hypothetical protein